MTLHFPGKILHRIIYGLLITGLSCLNTQAQNTSNKGKDFWVAYAAHIDGKDSQMSLYITSTLTTRGTVSIPGKNYAVSFSVNANSVTEVYIPADIAYVASSEVIEAKGIHITAEDPVVVYAHIYSHNRSGATLVLPTGTLGREYYTINYTQTRPKQHSQFMVVGVEDNTLVEITPTATTRGGNEANVPFNVTLMKGEVYQVQSDTDLTGSKVQSVSSGPNSCKRIAVFSGSSFVPFGCENAKTGDNLIQQLYPISAWGSNFVTAPLMGRLGGDIFRVVAGTDNTQITVNGVVEATLNKGQFYDFETDEPNFLSASNPVILAQYPRSQNCDKLIDPESNNIGDPEMIILSPIEQTLNNITLFSSPYYEIRDHYINILMKTAETGTFRLDGREVNFMEIPSNPEYSYARVAVAKGNHILKAANGFNAVAYGFGHVESYGYSAGANIKNLNHNITFNADTYCDGQTAEFTGYASYTPTAWKWYFGDGTTSTEVNPTHKYDAPGNYIVSMVTTKNNGNDCDSQDSTAVELTVYPNPVVGFDFTNLCAGDQVSFEDISTTSFNGNNIISWAWDFGDGNTSNEQHPSHQFAGPGIFEVNLQVKTAFGCTGGITQAVKIDPRPAPDFEATAVCLDFATVFQDKTTIAEGELISWEWDFGDSLSSEERNPEHTYKKAGTYKTTLIVTSAKGCTDSISRQVTVHPKPEIGMELPAICLRDEAEFVNTTTIESGTVNYLWDFGDGAGSAEENPRHKYTSEGDYKVILSVASDKGCTASMEKMYTVSGAEPVPEFSYTDLCQKDSVKFTDQSSIAFGNIVKWEWDFGDGSTSGEQHPVHYYAVPGTYEVTLSAYSGIVCTNTISKTITILPSPDAEFTVSDVCDGQTVTFLNNSSISTAEGLTWLWEFGDGGNSTAEHPTYEYASHGIYDVTLTVTATNGCLHRYTASVNIHPNPEIAFTPQMGCLPDEVRFTDHTTVAKGMVASWHWDFGDGSVSTEQHPVHKYSETGVYQIALETTTDQGCFARLVQPVEVVPSPVAVAGEDLVPVCGETSVRLEANNPAPATGLWTVVSGEGGTFSDASMPKAIFSGKMSERYTLRWTTRNGPCRDATDDIQVKFSPTPQVNAGEEVEIIEGETTMLAGTGDGTLSWSPAAYLDNPMIGTSRASPAETTTYTLQAATADGCTNQDWVTIRVLKRLQIPSGLSPNNDRINDEWLIGGVEDYPDLRVRIFNRWGDEIFNSTGYATPWDGSKRGQPLSEGVYYYIINFHQEREPYTGSVTLLK